MKIQQASAGGTRSTGLQPSDPERISRQLARALAALDMVAVAVIADDEGDVMLVATADAEAEVRRMRSVAKHALDLAAVRWAHSRDAARLVADGARGRLVASGRAMKGRWVACRPDVALAAVEAEAADAGLALIDDAGRLSVAAAKLERDLKRWER